MEFLVVWDTAEIKNTINGNLTWIFKKVGKTVINCKTEKVYASSMQLEHKLVLYTVHKTINYNDIPDQKSE